MELNWYIFTYIYHVLYFLQVNCTKSVLLSEEMSWSWLGSDDLDENDEGNDGSEMVRK